MNREFGEVASFGSRGCLAGVAPLRRALGSSGESGRPSCSAVQQSFDAMFELRVVSYARVTSQEVCVLLTVNETAPRGMATEYKGRKALTTSALTMGNSTLTYERLKGSAHIETRLPSCNG